jgi:predicted negative regulator of RcsB-dependent stress response
MRPTATLELVRGEALQNLGRREEARAAWERGRRLDPTNAELQQRLRPGP